MKDNSDYPDKVVMPLGLPNPIKLSLDTNGEYYECYYKISSYTHNGNNLRDLWMKISLSKELLDVKYNGLMPAEEYSLQELKRAKIEYLNTIDKIERL